MATVSVGWYSAKYSQYLFKVFHLIQNWHTGFLNKNNAKKGIETKESKEINERGSAIKENRALRF